VILTSAARSGGEVRITEAERPPTRLPWQEEVRGRNRGGQCPHLRALLYAVTVQGLWRLYAGAETMAIEQCGAWTTFWT
jgi:hypothetical protein